MEEPRRENIDRIVDLSGESFDMKDDVLKIWRKLYPLDEHVSGYLNDRIVPGGVEYRFILERNDISSGLYFVHDSRNGCRIDGCIDICHAWLKKRFGRVPPFLYYYEREKWDEIIAPPHDFPERPACW